MKTMHGEYENALETYQRTAEFFQRVLDSDGNDDEAVLEIRRSVPAGLYEHWKSTDENPKFYVVDGVGLEQDVFTPLVTYAALYAPHGGIMTFRHLLHPERGFLMPIDRALYRGARFCLVTKLAREEISVLLSYVGELTVRMDALQVRLHIGRLLKKSVPLF